MSIFGRNAFFLSGKCTYEGYICLLLGYLLDFDSGGMYHKLTLTLKSLFELSLKLDCPRPSFFFFLIILTLKSSKPGSVTREFIPALPDGLSGWLSGKESTCDAEDTGDAVDAIPGSGRSPGGEGMAAHSRIPVWRIPWTEEPGRRQSIG